MTDDAASKRQWIRSAVDFGALAAFAAAFVFLLLIVGGFGLGGVGLLLALVLGRVVVRSDGADTQHSAGVATLHSGRTRASAR